MNEQEYSYLKSKVFKLTGLDLNSYKSQQMRRRLEGFITRYNPPSVAAYCRILEQNQDKRKELLDFLAINVSEFFRDSPQFQYLRTLILPALLQRSSRLSIWSAACSCGQEPYSIAIILEELCPYHRHRILATDMDEDALTRATRGGPYSPDDVRNVERRLLQRFFVQTAEGYFVAEGIKRRVKFKKQNLLCGSFERDFDLVVCRNVIIYFSDDVKDRLYQEFYDSLKVDGVLFIGGSEVILQPNKLSFSMLCPSFYRKLPVSVGAALPVRA